MLSASIHADTDIAEQIHRLFNVAAEFFSKNVVIGSGSLSGHPRSSLDPQLNGNTKLSWIF